MRILATGLFLVGLLVVASLGDAQPPEGGKGKDKKDKGGPGGPGGKGGRTATVEEMVARVVAFDKNGDGKLTKEELTDTRLHPLFERADADKDGVVTKEELTALLTKESAALAAGGGGPGGFPGGPGGPGGFGPPPLGQILPFFVQDQLKLTDAQKKELDELQKELDAKIEKLLTDEQRKAYKEMKERGPGGPGGFPPPKQ